MPQQLARFGVHADQSLESQVRVLPDAVDLDRHDRRMRQQELLRILRLPYAFSRRFLEGGHQHATARGDHQSVFVDQRTLAVVPGRDLAVVLGGQELLPEELTIASVETIEFALRIDGEHESSVGGRCGARDRVIGPDALLDRVTPLFLTGVQREAADHPLRSASSS